MWSADSHDPEVTNGSRLTFSSGRGNLTFPTALVTGVCRSGKTTLGNLLATAEYVEHADEPWLPYMLPFMAGEGLINDELARDMFVTHLGELMRDMIMLRAANFRPTDLSTIWVQKSPEDIQYRLAHLTTRGDVSAYIARHRPLMLLNLAEVMPRVSFITDALPTCKVVHVVRRGLDVAQHIADKRWYSDEQLGNPVNAQLYKVCHLRGADWHLPWWVAAADEDCFLGYTEFERGLYYWCMLLDGSLEVMEQLAQAGRLQTVQFEQLIRDPAAVLDATQRFLDINSTDLTVAALQRVGAIQPQGADVGFSGLPRELRAKAVEIHQRLGYAV